MGWLGTIVIAMVLVAVGLYMLLGVAIILTALIERRPVKFLAPAEQDDPEWRIVGEIGPDHGGPRSAESDSNPYAGPGTSSYAETQIRAATQHGFSAPRLFKPVKGGIYKTYEVLTIFPSRQILAVVRWGTTASLRNEATVLYSALGDSRYLVTSDRPIGTRTPGFSDDQVFLGAGFDQLAGRHEQRIRTSGETIRQLSAENPLAEYEAIRAGRSRFLVASGDAYWVDREQTAIRSTLKGALSTYARTFSTKHVDQSLSAKAR